MWLSEKVKNIFVEYLDPQNPILDTKIMFLSLLFPEIIDQMCLGGHFGRHLEFFENATKFFYISSDLDLGHHNKRFCQISASVYFSPNFCTIVHEYELSNLMVGGMSAGIR